jgi:NAD(P)H-hydrate epimerase
VVVLKGHITIITNGDLLKINEAKTPALATMGTGDILSGIIGAYCTMHKDPFECSTAGVYIHSNIGDKLYEAKGNHIIAQDIIDMIPEFLKDFDVIG